MDIKRLTYPYTKVYRFVITLAFAFILFVQLSLSQNVSEKKESINIGFEAGIQFTGISDPYMPISENGIGFASGFFADYFLNDIIKIRGGLYFDNRKFSLGDFNYIYDTNLVHPTTSFYSVTRNYSVNYLTIPLSLMYEKGNGRLNFFIQGTLYYSLLINSNQRGDLHVFISEKDAPYFDFPDYPEFNVPGEYSYTVPDEPFNTSDIGINLLFGATYFLKPDLGITLSPGLSYSFANVWEDSFRETSWTSLYKINIGIIYTIK